MCLPALSSTLYIEKGSLVELETGDSSNLASQLNTGTLFLSPEHWDHSKVALLAFIGTKDLNSHFLIMNHPSRHVHFPIKSNLVIVKFRCK